MNYLLILIDGACSLVWSDSWVGLSSIINEVSIMSLVSSDVPIS